MAGKNPIIYPDIYKFKNLHANTTCVILGTGPTLKHYTPIKDSIHMSCNFYGTKHFCKDESFVVDYLFISDKPCLQDERVLKYKPKKYKFYGKFKYNIAFGPIPSYKSQIDALDIPYIVYENDDWKNHTQKRAQDWSLSRPLIKTYPNRGTTTERHCEWKLYNPLLETYPFGGTSTTAIKIFQFALYCGFTKILLVGCDCSHSYKNMVANWIAAKKFADKFYPNTEIAVINPINLKGVFKTYEAH